MKRYFYITPDDIEVAKQNGIPFNTLKTRVRQLGWDVDRAIKQPPKPMKRIPKRIHERAKANGISRDTLVTRINKLGWEHERACTEPVHTRDACLSIANESKRKYPKELIALAEQNGISAQNFRLRCRRGWDMHKAATTALIPTEVSIKRAKAASQQKPFIYGSKLHQK